MYELHVIFNILVFSFFFIKWFSEISFMMIYLFIYLLHIFYFYKSFKSSFQVTWSIDSFKSYQQHIYSILTVRVDSVIYSVLLLLIYSLKICRCYLCVQTCQDHQQMFWQKLPFDRCIIPYGDKKYIRPHRVRLWKKDYMLSA